MQRSGCRVQRILDDVIKTATNHLHHVIQYRTQSPAQARRSGIYKIRNELRQTGLGVASLWVLSRK